MDRPRSRSRSSPIYVRSGPRRESQPRTDAVDVNRGSAGLRGVPILRSFAVSARLPQVTTGQRRQDMLTGQKSRHPSVAVKSPSTIEPADQAFSVLSPVQELHLDPAFSISSRLYVEAARGLLGSHLGANKLSDAERHSPGRN